VVKNSMAKIAKIGGPIALAMAELWRLLLRP
jgi:hypothetical protein